jgi:uncharacterized protein
MKIKISHLADGIYEYHFSETPADVGLSDDYYERVDVAVTIDKSNRQLFLRGNITAAKHCTCDRCLDEFNKPLSTSYQVLYVLDGAANQKYHEDEVRVVTPNISEIEISDDVRQVVLLAVPLKLLCRDNCVGLCPQCGTNWNHKQCSCEQKESDVGWEELRGFLNN